MYFMNKKFLNSYLAAICILSRIINFSCRVFFHFTLFLADKKILIKVNSTNSHVSASQDAAGDFCFVLAFLAEKRYLCRKIS